MTKNEFLAAISPVMVCTDADVENHFPEHYNPENVYVPFMTDRTAKLAAGWYKRITGLNPATIIHVQTEYGSNLVLVYSFDSKG